jgi:glycosyltransferase involved in cell wall biosynthesis
MTSTPLVSICVQTYQHVNYIEQCIESIIGQRTSFQFEIILGEDESNDGTREICIEYARKYPTLIKLFLRKRKDVLYIDGSPTGRFNMLENIKAARGKYIALCEGDDFWIDECKLQKQVDFLESNLDYSLCATNTNILEESSKQQRIHPIPYQKEWYAGSDLLNTYNFIKTVSVMFRNVQIRNIEDKWQLVPFGDLYLFLVMSEVGKIKILDSVTSIYRVHDSGSWNGIGSIQREHKYQSFYEIIRNDFKDKYKNICDEKIASHRKNRYKLYLNKMDLKKRLKKFIYAIKRRNQ